MMGYDDMAVSFAISVGAGYVPNIISLIKGNKTLNDKIDKCFRNALGKLDINEETRKLMRYDMLKHYTDLQRYLTDKSQGIHPKTKELLRLWVEELRNDEACMLFIVEHKQEVIDCKLDNVLETLKSDVSNKLDEILTNQSELSDQMSQIMSMLKDGKNSDDKLLATKIESILNSSVKDMIEALKVDTARKLLDEIEMQFAETLSKNETVNALLLYRKAQTLHWSSAKSAVEYYHQAYLKCPRNIEYVKSQIIRNIQLKDYSHAKELASDLDVNAPLIHLINIVESEEPKKVFLEIPDSVRNNYTFRYDCLTLLISKDDIEDVTWLFDNIECEIPGSVTFSNLRNWLFLLSYQRYKMGNFLFLSFESSQVKGLDEPLHIYGAFKDNIEKTELHGAFNDVLCLYCYWNYVKSQESRWITEFQYKANSIAGEQRSYFDLMEASMLSLAGRYEEAFVKIASLPFNLEMFRMLIMMAIHSKQESHVVWALEKAKEQKISLPSDESSLVAHFLMHIKTAAVRSVLSGNDFDNPTDGLLLQQMCKYYEKIDFDETTSEGNVDSLCDHMKAYAAMLLAKKAKTKVAFDMLNPIVEKERNCNITKRVFLDVLMQMQEKQGDLYSILVENRKAGNVCDDDLLIEEYKLDSAVADYQNALEVITELKNRQDTTENYVHYLVTLGHVHPEDLRCHESKVLSISFDNTHFVAMLYKVFSENGYIITACELLWKYARTTEDYGLKMLFYNESMSGSLYSVVNEEYEIAREGNFVLCDIEGKRKMYKASDNGSDICKRLVGKKKDDLVVIEIGFEKQEARIIAVCNKYRKLAYDIMQESMDGSNPYMKPFKVDMEHPIESIEAMEKKISGDDMSPLDREKIAVEKYNRGEYSLIQLIDDVNVVSGYYKLLFSAFNVHTEPCKENLQKLRAVDLSNLKFILDLPSVILFHEFTAVKGIELDGYPQITSLQVEQVEDFCKAPSRYLGLEIYEAMRSKHIMHYSEYVDEDAKCHLKNLLSWMKTHCEVIIPSQALPLITQKDSTPLKKQLFSALSTLMQPNYVFVTDDIRIKKMLPMVNIITTETYVRLFCNKETSEAYSKFLFDCHFDGIEMSEDFIIEQYMKMYNKEENDFVRIVQNMQMNPLLIDVVNNVGLKLVDKVLDIRTLQMTLTNMYAMLFKGLKPVAVDNIATIAQYEMDVNIFALQFVRQCMLDAVLIVRS